MFIFKLTFADYNGKIKFKMKFKIRLKNQNDPKGQNNCVDKECKQINLNTSSNPPDNAQIMHVDG